jgi:hypothetical protein
LSAVSAGTVGTTLVETVKEKSSRDVQKTPPGLNKNVSLAYTRLVMVSQRRCRDHGSDNRDLLGGSWTAVAVRLPPSLAASSRPPHQRWRLASSALDAGLSHVIRARLEMTGEYDLAPIPDLDDEGAQPTMQNCIGTVIGLLQGWDDSALRCTQMRGHSEGLLAARPAARLAAAVPNCVC